MKPPFKVTLKTLNLCSDITRLLGQYEGLKRPIPQPILRRQNRIKTIHASLAIEGNILTEKQITDIINNKKVIGPKKDIVEVKNAIQAYNNLQSYKICNIESFLSSHRIMMQGLMTDAGQLRNKNVGVFKGKKAAHIAPKAQLVPKLMNDLFKFLKNKDDIHPLVKSSVFHYELEFIHPFSDGNGRLGRLWQTAILLHYHSMFENIPIETVIRKKQKQYYKVLSVADRTGTSTGFIEFMLQTIYEAVEQFLKDVKPQVQTTETRIVLAKDYFKNQDFSRKDYLSFHKNISTATASRDLFFGVKNKILKKTGKKSLTRYLFIRAH